jgi:uncharacterized membrane protein
VVVAALLSAVHILTLALGLGGVFARGRALERPLDDAGWKRLLAADDVWGVAALLWITTGLGRLFFGGREMDFYRRNGFFWLKLGPVLSLLVSSPSGRWMAERYRLTPPERHRPNRRILRHGSREC